MNADGSNRKWLCKGWYPRWSPNGKEICYHAYFESRPQLGFYNVETGVNRTILGDDISVEFGGATWSPYGKRVALIGVVDGRQQLLTINADGNRDSMKVLYREHDANRRLVGPPVGPPTASRLCWRCRTPIKPAAHGCGSARICIRFQPRFPARRHCSKERKPA